MPFSEKKILIIRLGAIGDVIRTLPALNALKKSFPGSHVAWLVEDKSESILTGHPQIDDLIILKRTKWQKQIFKPFTFFPTIKEVFYFFGDLRKKKFDLVLDFHGILKSGIASFLSGANDRMGFSRKFSKEFNFLFNNHRISLPGEKLNRVEKNLRFLGSLGIDGDAWDVVFPLLPEDKANIDTFFQKNIDPDRKPFIVMHPGSSKNTGHKRWDPLNYSRLADKLIEDYRATIILTWGSEERKLVENIAARMKNEPVLACKTNSLRELAELIKRCNLYIGGDTAPMHIASFSNIPVLAIFGPTDPLVNSPYGKNKHIIVRKELFCSPCRNRKCPTRMCMEIICWDEVFRAAEKLLGENEEYE